MRIKYKILIPISLVALLAAGCGKSAPSIPATNPPAATNQNQSTTANVTINNFAFSPANLTVKQGTTVTWTNNDSVAHTIIGDSGGPSSGTLGNGSSYSFTYSQPGTYPYHCGIHPNMTGTITVTQ